jgi:hypothetical protein
MNVTVIPGRLKNVKSLLKIQGQAFRCRWPAPNSALLVKDTINVMALRRHCPAVFLLLKGYCFYDQTKSLLLVLEPGLFIYLIICGRFWGKIYEFGRNLPEKRTLEGTDLS